jgi:hypothetical protein
MAWKREYHKGQKGLGEVWAAATDRPSEATNSIIWTSTQLWTVVQWTKEVK